MSHFVAEDRVHLRQGRGGFVSQCGYVYPSISVDWAGDYKPEAYETCDKCGSEAPRTAPPAQDAIVVQGVYAVDDDAHLWVRRSEGAWHSVCGRDDANHTVAWADDEWPVAYDACSTCLDLVEADLWQPDVEGGEPSEPTDEDRYRAYRVWVIQDQVEHRARDRALMTTMCGDELRVGMTPQFTQTSRAAHCHDCDSAVGRARAGLPIEHTFRKPKATPPKRQSPKRRAPEPKRPIAPRPEKYSVMPGRQKRSGQRRSTAKEVALFGRKMIVPIRFVRGGAPGLGRRR